MTILLSIDHKETFFFMLLVHEAVWAYIIC